MKYVLKNKDIAVLEFEVETKKIAGTIDNKREEIVSTISNIDILDKMLIPKNMAINSNDTINDASLETWIRKRKAPNNRKYVEKIIVTYSFDRKERLMDYVDISLGLSLNDSFWIIPSNKDYKWKDYNLYDNKFDKALELVAFNGASHKISGFTSSPEYTTNGMLKKCWHRDGNDIFLYKSSSEPFANCGKEAYAEFYMAQIAKAMNLNHVSYDLKEFHDEIVSSCKIFTNENEGYMPIYYCLDKEGKRSKEIRLINAISKIYGTKALEDLMLFDSIIANTDRHLGNFGMIVDNNTNKILRPAPIFDNGLSMMNFLMEKELTDIKANAMSKESYFGYSFEEQMKISSQPRHIKPLEKLLNFTFKRHEKFNLDESWLKPIESHIQESAKEAIAIAKEKAKILMKSQNHDKSRNNSQKRNKGREL